MWNDRPEAPVFIRVLRPDLGNTCKGRRPTSLVLCPLESLFGYRRRPHDCYRPVDCRPRWRSGLLPALLISLLERLVEAGFAPGSRRHVRAFLGPAARARRLAGCLRRLHPGSLLLQSRLQSAAVIQERRMRETIATGPYLRVRTRVHAIVRYQLATAASAAALAVRGLPRRTYRARADTNGVPQIRHWLTLGFPEGMPQEREEASFLGRSFRCVAARCRRRSYPRNVRTQAG